MSLQLLVITLEVLSSIFFYHSLGSFRKRWHQIFHQFSVIVNVSQNFCFHFSLLELFLVSQLIFHQVVRDNRPDIPNWPDVGHFGTLYFMWDTFFEDLRTCCDGSFTPVNARWIILPNCIVPWVNFQHSRPNQISDHVYPTKNNNNAIIWIKM